MQACIARSLADLWSYDIFQNNRTRLSLFRTEWFPKNAVDLMRASSGQLKGRNLR